MDGLLVDSEPIWHDVEIDVFGRHGVPLTVAALSRDQGDVPRRRRRALVPRATPGAGRPGTRSRSRSPKPWPGASKRRWSSSPAPCTPWTSGGPGRGAGAGVVVAAPAHRRRGAPLGLAERFAVVAFRRGRGDRKARPRHLPHHGAAPRGAPGACVVFEDSAAGVLGAVKSAGMACVAVPEDDPTAASGRPGAGGEVRRCTTCWHAPMWCWARCSSSTRRVGTVSAARPA